MIYSARNSARTRLIILDAAILALALLLATASPTFAVDGDIIETGVENGKLMAFLGAHSEVLSTRYTDTKVTIHCRIPQKYLGRVNESEATIRPHEPNGKVEGKSYEADPTEVVGDDVVGDVA